MTTPTQPLIKDVSIPWVVCLITGIVFGIALCINSGNDNWFWRLIRFCEFEKLSWVGFGFFGFLVVLMMIFLSKCSNARALLSILISFLFNGMVGGYLGIAIWNVYVGDVRDGVEFLGWAWVTYVWFFLSLNVITHGIKR